MAGKIFISYRREDARADARLVDQRLRTTFGGDRIFFDVDTIQKGRDFRKVLAEALDSSNVLLAIIGPTWLTATDNTGRRRIDDPSDFVRLEIANALKRDIAVIPVLVGGAKMPRDEDLPIDLRGLAYRQAAIITHDNFPHDVDGLEHDVRALVSGKRQRTGGGRKASLALGFVALIAASGIALQRFGSLDRWLTVATPAIPTEDASRKVALEVAEKARLDAERRQAAAQHAEAARKEQEAKLAAAAVAKRLADEQEQARAAAAAATELAAQKARADEALRKAQEAERNRSKEFIVSGWANLTNECQVIGVPELELAKAPRFGTIQFRNDDVLVRIVSSREREHCIGRTVKGRIANYTLNEKDLANNGTDQVSIRVKFGSGAESLEDYDINLAQRKATHTKSVTQQAETVRKTQDAERNRPIEFPFWGWVNMNNDCQAIGIPKIEVVKAPKFGTIQFRDEDVPIRIVSSKEREHCIGRVLKGREAYYTVNEKDRSTASTDQVSLRVIFFTGYISQEDFDLDLGQRKATRTKAVQQ